MKRQYWIKTTDRLPGLTKTQKRYACIFHVTETHKVHAGAFIQRIRLWKTSKTDTRAFESQDGTCFTVAQVSHWRKLPTVPFIKSPPKPKCAHPLAQHQEEMINSNGMIDQHIQLCSGCGTVLKRWNTPTQKGK